MLVLEEHLNIDIKIKVDDYKIFMAVSENSGKWNSVKKEIEKIDGEIDERIFGLYGLSEEEIKIIKQNKK